MVQHKFAWVANADHFHASSMETAPAVPACILAVGHDRGYASGSSGACGRIRGSRLGLAQCSHDRAGSIDRGGDEPQFVQGTKADRLKLLITAAIGIANPYLPALAKTMPTGRRLG